MIVLGLVLLVIAAFGLYGALSADIADQEDIAVLAFFLVMALGAIAMIQTGVN